MDGPNTIHGPLLRIKGLQKAMYGVALAVSFLDDIYWCKLSARFVSRTHLGALSPYV